jgi:hypothetical protein
MAKKQANFINIGKLAINIILLVFVVSSINNVLRQVKILLRANKENTELQAEVNRLQEENIRLEQNIRYATSSAGIRAMVHEYFGLGEIGDRWIKVPDLSKEEDNKDAVVESEANWRLWLRLFTNRI